MLYVRNQVRLTPHLGRLEMPPWAETSAAPAAMRRMEAFIVARAELRVVGVGEVVMLH